MIIGIDASNIKSDGGKVHLFELINNSTSLKKIEKIIIWGDQNLLKKITNKKNIVKIYLNTISNNLLYRFFWQFFIFPKELVSKDCDLALIPGGIFFNKKIKTISIFQNILPFIENDVNKYSLIERFKLRIQKMLYIKSFNNSDGIIFLSNFSKKIIKKFISLKNKKTIIIPHGVSRNFKYVKQKFNRKHLKLLYVSKIDLYKNHLVILDAIKLLNKNQNAVLSLVGSFEKKLIQILTQKIKKLKLEKKIKIYGKVNYKKLPKIYNNHDLKLYASQSETFGMTMLESIKCGLPVLATNNAISKEILKNAGYYCKNNSRDIEKKVIDIFNDKKVLNSKIKLGLKQSERFTWRKTSLKTFLFLSSI